MNYSGDLVLVKAKITFKSAEEGGKTLPIRNGYRPNHFFENPALNKMPASFVGDVYFQNDQPVLPGTTTIATIRFLNEPEIKKYLVIGQQWFINEGRRNVATAEIVEM
jgi:translation elongation factor EF-Tu-like GTPase